jgi:hypothetical protein
MKTFLIALLLAAMPLGGAVAAPYAPQDFDFSDLDGVAYGTVELVQPAPPSPTELAEKAEAALVRLDDGRSVTVVLRPLQHFEAGERVRVVRGAKGARIERAGGPLRLAQFVADVTVPGHSETAATCALVTL